MSASFDLAVEADDEQPEEVERRFKVLSGPAPCSYFVEGSERFSLVGIEDGREVAASSLVVEDSGDGEAVLIVGGRHGLLLRSLAETRREPYLLLARDVPFG